MHGDLGQSAPDDAVFGGQRFFQNVVEDAFGWPMGALVAQGVSYGSRSMTSSASSVLLSSLSCAASDRVAGTESATARLACSIWAMRSSTVPWVMRRCTWTGLCWPMR